MPGANGTGAFGEILSTPVVGSPAIGHNQTFVSLGEFDTEFEAEALLKYLKSKFARSMLGIMKTTQNNQSKITWSKVPLQNFTKNSDIDWSRSISVSYTHLTLPTTSLVGSEMCIRDRIYFRCRSATLY